MSRWLLAHLRLRVYVAIAAAIIAFQAAVEHLMGRGLICKCGYVKFWEGEVLSAGNSQHLVDWYSFSHIIHGFLFYALFWLLDRRWPVGLRLVLTVLVEASWEIFENTSFVIERYRAATISLDYYGDSVLNSVSDTLMAVLGFGLAGSLPVAATVTLAVLMEIGVGYMIRDNFTLNVVMLVHPMDWLKFWQATAQTR